jgi:conjugative relaxase-like TrwC/TraI family protein
VVASISARGSATAALGYYAHLSADDYYMRGGEPPGRWAGAAAERLGLDGPVTRTEFAAALAGRDPQTGAALVQHSGARDHAAGWDMTFSAPKSVSVLWALSAEPERRAIEDAHREAVRAATGHLEQTAAWTRRGPGGRIREPTAGLLMAQFDHHTSRESDPQLHTHGFIFNFAPRRDGSWGSIVSRSLYTAQKDAGAIYRHQLADELERRGYRLDRQTDDFRVAAIPRTVEQAFSKRRQAIEEAARTHGYSTAKGMELAALRTRRPKREAKLEALLESWRDEAKALGFELRPEAQRAAQQARQSESRGEAGRANEKQPGAPPPAPNQERGRATRANGAAVNISGAGRQQAAQTFPASPHSPAQAARPFPQTATVRTAAPSPATSTTQLSPAQIGSLLGAALLSLGQPSGMAGLRVPLRDRAGERREPRQHGKDRRQEYEAE